jgi:ATP-dependent exoDNAse (exonuclease V) alpha subunit
LVRLWNGKWGERIATLASIRLRPVARQAIAAQATEVALGRATDALYEALPSTVRKQLEHVPSTVRRLEKEATVLRGLVRDLEASISSVDSNARLAVESGEAAALRSDLQRAREDSNQRLANTVAALETIRLGLIRLQLGTGPVETVTATLDAARAVAEDIERAADAQKEVERLLRATQSHQSALKPVV